MASQRNTGAFVLGSVIGGIVGAAAVLWKTPKSGVELRDELSGNRHDVVTYRAGGDGAVTEERRFSNPVLGFVERATAPIVGVELGKLARDDPQATAATPVRSSAADAKPPVRPVGGEPVAVRHGHATATGAAAGVTGSTSDATDIEAQDPSEEVTHDAVEGSSAHAATPEELTTPTPEYAEQLAEETGTTGTASGDASFPEFPRRDDDR